MQPHSRYIEKIYSASVSHKDKSIRNSRMSKTSTNSSNINNAESSLWQFSTVLDEYDQYYKNQHQTWKSVTSKLALMSSESHSSNTDFEDHHHHHRKFHNFSKFNILGMPFNRHRATLPAAEMLPRNEVLGGFIFVCNNDTMLEDLRRLLFGLPQKYKDSVRAITPGLPLFLYNYTTHQLHGVYQAVSFGGSNIDPTAWKDKKCKGESRFPAQVRIRIKKKCKPLEEDAFRPILFHYDGPKFRLQLSVPEALALLDLFKEEDQY